MFQNYTNNLNSYYGTMAIYYGLLISDCINAIDSKITNEILKHSNFKNIKCSNLYKNYIFNQNLSNKRIEEKPFIAQLKNQSFFFHTKGYLDENAIFNFFVNLMRGKFHFKLMNSLAIFGKSLII